VTQTSVPRRPVQEPKTGRHEATDVRDGEQGQRNSDNSVDDSRHSTAVRLGCDVTVTLATTHKLSLNLKHPDTKADTLAIFTAL